MSNGQGQDYVFAAGPDTAMQNARAFFTNKSKTTVIGGSDGDPTNVADFLNRIQNDVSNDSVGELWIVSHSSPNGWMNVDLSSSSKKTEGTTYGTLVDALSAGTIKLPKSIFHGDAVVNISGCNVGQAPVFVDKLREAFDADLLTAPKHWNFFVNSSLWALEYLAYDFRFRARPGTIENRQELVNAFANDPLNSEIGQNWDENDWDKWLQKDWKNDYTIRVFEDLGVGNNSQLPSSKIKLSREYIRNTETVPLVLPYMFQDKDKRNDKYAFWKSGNGLSDEQEDEIKNMLNDTLIEHKEFPWFRQLHYKSSNQYVAVKKWTVSKRKKHSDCKAHNQTYDHCLAVTVTGKNMIYIFKKPVLKDDGTLKYNLYSKSSSGPTIERLDHKDSALFYQAKA